MALNYDWFVAAMPCPVCGAVSARDEAIEMYTYARAHSDGADLGVGDAFAFPPGALAAGILDGYLTLCRPDDGEPVRLLNSWRCRTCGSLNWAEIVVADDRIATIDATPLDRNALARTHFIQNNAEFVAADLVGATARLTDDETLTILRRLLP